MDGRASCHLIISDGPQMCVVVWHRWTADEGVRQDISVRRLKCCRPVSGFAASFLWVLFVSLFLYDALSLSRRLGGGQVVVLLVGRWHTLGETWLCCSFDSLPSRFDLTALMASPCPNGSKQQALRSRLSLPRSPRPIPCWSMPVWGGPRMHGVDCIFPNWSFALEACAFLIRFDMEQ